MVIGPARNDYLDQWRRTIPAAKNLLSLAGGIGWETFQQTNQVVGTDVYARIRAAKLENRELAQLFRAYKQQRRRLRRFYAYSVPCPTALTYLARQELGLLEIGCGKAYWAHLLRSEGVDVVASDIVPLDENRWVFGEREFLSDIVVGRSVKTLLKDYQGRSILLQWIPRGPEGQYAIDILQYYRGEHLFVVGEGMGGATACDAWFRALDAAWHCIKRLSLPRFFAITDSLYHYVRRNGCT